MKVDFRSLISPKRDDFISKGIAARDSGDWRVAVEAYTAKP